MENSKEGLKLQNTSNIGTKNSVHLLTKEAKSKPQKAKKRKNGEMRLIDRTEPSSEAFSLPMLSSPFIGLRASTLSRRRRYPMINHHLGLT